MAVENARPDDAELARLISASKEIITTYVPDGAVRWLLVDVYGQRLILVRDQLADGAWPVSTAAVGLDNREGSGGTPPGLHRIERKIGADAETGTVFASREPTGEIWRPDAKTDDDRDLILTRVLTLEGLEPGVNQGPGIDSRERYIYIHGTNEEDRVGSPVSHGCVRMANDAVQDLFDLVEEGDLLVII